MSRLRWNTYDDRGARWRAARTRGVAAAAALALAGVAGLASSATTSRAEDVPAPAPGTADLDALAQRQAAEEAAVRRAHLGRVAELEAQGRTRLAALAESLAADLAGLDRAAVDAAVQRDVQRGAALSQVGEDRTAAGQTLLERFALARGGIDAFFADVLTVLGPESGSPSKTALAAAKKQLETRRSNELSALDASQAQERSALQAQVSAAVAALDAEAARLDAEHKAHKAALSAALSQVTSALATELAVTLRAIEAETTAIRARHAQELLDVELIHRTQTAAAAASSGAVRSALSDRQELEERQLKALHANEVAAQSYAASTAKADETEARRAAEAQLEVDEKAAESSHALARSAVAEAKSSTASTGSTAVRALDDEHAARFTAVKTTYDTAISGIAKGHAGVRVAWSDRVIGHDREQVAALEALDVRTRVRSRDVEDASAARGSAASRQLGHDREARERRHKKDVRLAGWSTKQALGRADRDRDRRLRLLASEYFTLRIRAVAFSERPDAFTSVGAAYDPEKDPGSLYNVAKRIGATDLPAHITGAGVDVALIDTGVVDVPGLALADVEIGPDFSFEEVVPELRGRDTMGHGTHLAGIIAARDGDWLAGRTARQPERVLGIAPGSGLVSIKAGASDGSVDVTQIIAAINWVIRNRDTDGRNIRVLNLSFGTDGVQDYRLDPLSFAVERAWQAGIVVVVAGGNDGWASSRLTNPAQDPYVLAVGSSQAVDGKEDVPSSFSEGSADGRGVDLSAPGRSVVSLRNEGSSADEHNTAGRVGETLVRGSGTSQSAAVVSGAVALLLQARPELTPDQVKHVLKDTADEPGSGDAELAGAGYLRVDRAIKASVPYVKQTWPRSTGAGTLDGARGSVRVALDGIVLEGEYDVFGRSWTGAKWSEDSWSGAKWSGAKWSGAVADGAAWTGAKWSSDMWAGSDWTGAKWSTDFWSGAKWSGAKWSAAGFTGAKWSGAKWSSGGWFGVGWDDGPSESVSTGGEPVSDAAVSAAAVG